MDWVEYKNMNSSRRINIPINQARNTLPWKYSIQIEAIDKNNNRYVEEIKLEVLDK
jgi:hypothetical protein